MAEPEVRSGAGVWSFRFPADQVEVRVERVKQHSDRVTGEVAVTSTTPGRPSHLHQASLNLSSTLSRQQLVRTLTERRDDVDWYAIVEKVCVYVLQELRRGEPVTAVGLEPPSPQRYRIFPFCPEGQISLIFGEGGSGKSTLAIFLGLLVQGDIAFPGVRVTPGRVLYLDYETSPAQVNHIIHCLKAGMGWEEELSLDYRRCFLPLSDDIAEVQRAVADTEASLVIVDSVGMACVGEEASASYDTVAIRLMRALRSLNTTCLLIDHVAKDQEKGKRTPFGSIYKLNQARSVWELAKEEPEIPQSEADTEEEGQAPRSAIEVGLIHCKVNYSRLLQPVGFRFTFGPGETIDVMPLDPKGHPHLTERLPLSIRLMAALNRGPKAVEELAEELEVKVDTLKRTLNRHKQRFIKVGEKWGLATKEQGGQG